MNTLSTVVSFLILFNVTKIAAHTQPTFELNNQFLVKLSESQQMIGCSDLIFNYPDTVAEIRAADRPSCKEKYPLPEGYENWHCSSPGRSVCGGPDVCRCEPSERLFHYPCDEGSYDRCETDDGCK